MNPVTKVDEITALEYSALKVPYELLNKKFRIAQKAIERHNYRVKEAGAQLLNKFQEEKNDEVVEVKKISGYVKAVLERLELLQQCLPQTVNDEFSMAKLLESRLHYLKGANSGDRWAVDAWRQQRVDRLIIDYLLRSGYFETAQKLAEHSDVQDMCNKTIFEIARQVEDSLSRHETDRCMEWIIDNKSKLRRLKSNFEVIVRIQECVELVRRGERIQAVLYARKHFSNLSAQLWTSVLPLQKIMGLIGFGQAYGEKTYKSLFADSRWEMLVELFRKENARIFQLMEYSTFNACLCMGISAMKTPYCKPDSLSRCPVCQPEINELADDLPFAHSLNSKLICAYSGEPLDENNPPYMLPNGRVYGQRAIELLCKDSYIRCPRTNEVFPLNTVVRLWKPYVYGYLELAFILALCGMIEIFAKVSPREISHFSEIKVASSFGGWFDFTKARELAHVRVVTARRMPLSFYGLLEASLLVVNAISILNKERFLKKIGLTSTTNTFDTASEESTKQQFVNLVLAVQTVMRSKLQCRKVSPS